MNANAFLKNWVEEARNTDKKRLLCVELREKDHNGEEVLHLRCPTFDDAADFLGWRPGARSDPEPGQFDPWKSLLMEEAKDVLKRLGPKENADEELMKRFSEAWHRQLTPEKQKEFLDAWLGKPGEPKLDNVACQEDPMAAALKELDKTIASLQDKAYSKDIPDRPGMWLFRHRDGDTRVLGAMNPVKVFIRRGGLCFQHPHELIRPVDSFPKEQWGGPADLKKSEETKPAVEFRATKSPSGEAADTLKKLNDMLGCAAAPKGVNRFAPKPVAGNIPNPAPKLKPMPGIPPRYPGRWYCLPLSGSGTYGEVSVFSHSDRGLCFRNDSGEIRSVSAFFDSHWGGPVYQQDFGPEKVAVPQDPGLEEQLFPNAPGNWWFHREEYDEREWRVVFFGLTGELMYAEPEDGEDRTLFRILPVSRTSLPQWSGKVADFLIARHHPTPGIAPQWPGKWWLAEVSTQMWKVVDVKAHPGSGGLDNKFQFQSSYSTLMADVTTIPPERWGGMACPDDEEVE